MAVMKSVKVNENRKQLGVHGNGTIRNRARSRSGTPADPVQEERVASEMRLLQYGDELVTLLQN
jgi:hypothetical protein